MERWRDKGKVGFFLVLTSQKPASDANPTDDRQWDQFASGGSGIAVGMGEGTNSPRCRRINSSAMRR